MAAKNAMNNKRRVQKFTKVFLTRYIFLSGIVLNIGMFGILFYGIHYLFSKDIEVADITSKIADKMQKRYPSTASVIRSTGSTPFIKDAFAEMSLDSWQGQGANPNRSIPDIGYDNQGNPVSVNNPQAIKFPSKEHAFIEKLVTSTKELIKAINHAKPGDRIILLNGVYKIRSLRINVNNPGSIDQPIYVMARKLGDVQIEFDAVEGFFVAAPFWVFQNLEIQGACANDSRCEHAFHIVGGGSNTVIRNNIVTDFNSQIKANGTRKNNEWRYPDFILVEANSFYNHRIRDTSNPVTVLDMVGVNNWLVQDNLVADFFKGRGNRVSYAAFFKGNGKDNIFQRNLVICQARLYQEAGARVGLSFGGGGTGKQSCRNKECGYEHLSGILRHNVVMHCDDVGVYLNKSKNTQIYNNTLINTLGIDVRFEKSDAVIFNNILTGRIKNRNGGSSKLTNNVVVDLDDIQEIFANPMKGDLNLRDAKKVVDKGVNLQREEIDFCGTPRQPSNVDIGAFEYTDNKTSCNPFTMNRQNK